MARRPRPTPAPIVDGTTDCRVWLTSPADLPPRQLGLLSAVERNRYDRLALAEDRARGRTGALLLRLAAAQVLGLTPAAVPIERTCARCGRPHGRPQIPGDPIGVSVSHSGDLVAVAIASTVVGIDVEQLRPIDPAVFGPLVLHPGDIASSRSGGECRQLLTHWVRKEAVVKATGDGLTVELADITISGAGRVTGYPGRPEIDAFAVDLAVTDGYVGALAMLSARPPIVEILDGTVLLDRTVLRDRSGW